MINALSLRSKAARPMRWFGLAFIAGIVLAILGPFGSYVIGGPATLLGYWIGAMLLGVLLYSPAFKIVGALTTIGSRRWWLALTGATLLASIPEAIITRTAALRLWPRLRPIDVPLWLWFLQTATIGLIVMVAVGMALRRSASTPRHDLAPIAVSDTVASALSGDVLALQMEDHYVRVHRSHGSELILLPLSRAIEAVRVEGLRTHRSWWVARHAVTAAEGDARAMRLRLSNGLVAPVARSAIVHLKAAGWIANGKPSARRRDRD